MRRRQAILSGLVIALCCTCWNQGALGQTKFWAWFRERIGERPAKDVEKAKQDAKWQKEHFADDDVREQFVKVAKKETCNVCHVKGSATKTIRNPFGSNISEALRAEMKLDSKGITAALRASAPEPTRLKIEQAFHDCLDKALKAHVKPDDEESETFGDRIQRGELPAPPEELAKRP
jgi:hypothetical protein